jgi:hypothetical protein
MRGLAAGPADTSRRAAIPNKADNKIFGILHERIISPIELKKLAEMEMDSEMRNIDQAHESGQDVMDLHTAAAVTQDPV